MVRKVLIAAIMLPAIMWLHGETKTDFTETRYGIEMVYVEGGTFMMGCLPQENCSFLSPKPRNETVNSFYIGKYEVTQGQWADVMETDVRQYLYNARDGLRRRRKPRDSRRELVHSREQRPRVDSLRIRSRHSQLQHRLPPCPQFKVMKAMEAPASFWNQAWEHYPEQESRKFQFFLFFH